MLLDNWPETIISKDGYCEKCICLCKFCSKYVDNKNVILRKTAKGNKIRYCEQCLRDKREPKGTKYRYDIILDDKNFHTGWKKVQMIIKCTRCKRDLWVKYKSLQKVCNRCSGKKTKDKLVDPSDNNNRYKLVKGKWELYEVANKCKKCLLMYWVKKDNISSNNLFGMCSNCNPSTETDKYKYDKKNQLWIFYRKRTNCKVCDKIKWMYVDENNPDIFICKKCSNCT